MPIFPIAEAAPTPAVGKADYSDNWTIRPQSSADGVAEDGAKQSNGSGGGASPAPHVRHGTWLCKMRTTLRRASCNVMHELLDVLPRDLWHFTIAKQWFDVCFDTAAVGRQSTLLFVSTSPGQKPPLSSSRQVFVAKFGYGRGAAPSKLLRRGILSLDDLRKKALRFVPSCVGSPRRSVTTNCVPALASFPRAIFQRVEHRCSLPATGTKPRDARIPKRPVLTKLADVLHANFHFCCRHW